MPASIHETYLSNGLKVILKEVHLAPVVSTWLWYRVGSRNEVGGLTGLAHWIEHMMFKGSPNFAKGSIMRMVDRNGGQANAMTSHDFTAYFATLPADRAELALRIEADRMTGALFDEDEFEAERQVVIAEREGAENTPHFVLAEEVTAAAFRLYPYHHQAIGWKEDLASITRDQLYAFYRQYYVPNNAVLVVVGDVSEAYLDTIDHHLGHIPQGDLLPEVIRQEPPLRGERRVTLHLPGSTRLVRVSYRTPPVRHEDYIPLVVLDAVLSGGKAMFAFDTRQTRSARLYHALVETELASDAGSNYHPSLDPYLLNLGATVREEREPEEVEEALLAQVARLRDEPVQEEDLEVAIRQAQAHFAYSSESVTGQALTLGFLEMLDDYRRMESILDELAGVTPEDVQRVARTYLTADNRIVGYFLPTEEDRDAQAAAPAADPWVARYHDAWFYSPARPPTISAETVVRRRLDNGITLLIRENPATASVSMEGNIAAGTLYEEGEALGLSAITASMLRRGTAQHTYQELYAALDNVGAALGISAGRDSIVLSGQSLAADFDLLIDLLAEMLTTPTFPESELRKLCGQLSTRLRLLETDTEYRAQRAFMTSLYPPGHPYARPLLGTRQSLTTLSREHLIDFYKAYYHPQKMIMSVVGAVEAEHVIERVEAALGDWKPDRPPTEQRVPPAEIPQEIVTERVPLAGKAQVDLILGTVGMERSSPDYYPAMMANIILGQLGLMGRLGETVRDNEGLAYSVESYLRSGLGPHPWFVSAGVHPQKVDAAVEAILREIGRLRQEPVPDEELEDCRSYLTGTLPLQLETNEGVAVFLLNLEQYGLGLDYLQRYPHLIGDITKKQIQDVMIKYFPKNRYVLAMAGTFE
ncbi:MAG: pitrilysin family protein [Chloroflexota bacterium]|nr:pitrilysin family protein [Chloroflexota bacterium]